MVSDSEVRGNSESTIAVEVMVGSCIGDGMDVKTGVSNISEAGPMEVGVEGVNSVEVRVGDSSELYGSALDRTIGVRGSGESLRERKHTECLTLQLDLAA